MYVINPTEATSTFVKKTIQIFLFGEGYSGKSLPTIIFNAKNINAFYLGSEM